LLQLGNMGKWTESDGLRVWRRKCTFSEDYVHKNDKMRTIKLSRLDESLPMAAFNLDHKYYFLLHSAGGVEEGPGARR